MSPRPPMPSGSTCAIDTDVSQLERMTGIEPAFSAWEADVLPLYDIRVLGWTPDVIGSSGFPKFRESKERQTSEIRVRSQPIRAVRPVAFGR